MAKIQISSGTTNIDFEGNSEEIDGFLHSLAKSGLLSSSGSAQVSSSETVRQPTVTGMQETMPQARRTKLPSNEEIRAFIIDQPNLAHSAQDAHLHFYQRVLKARGEDSNLHHRMAELLRTARQDIEREKGGIFEPNLDLKTGVKKFTFKKKMIRLGKL